MIKGRADKTRSQKQQSDSELASLKGANLGTQRRFGTITEPHSELNDRAKISYTNGVKVAKGRWIQIIDAERVLDNYGKLRRGMEVEITFNGEIDQIVRARIIGTGDQTPVLADNSKDLGLYLLFNPGMPKFV